MPVVVVVAESVGTRSTITMCVLQATVLRKEIAELQAQLTETRRLLQVADPEGYYTPESMAAREAAVKAAKALQEARQKKAEEAARKKAEEAARTKAEQAAFVPEEEEEEAVRKEVQDDVHALAGSDGKQQAGLVVRKPKAAALNVQAEVHDQPPAAPPVLMQEQEALPGMRKPTREEVLQRLAASRGGRGRGGEDVEATARAKVLADLALLSGAKGAKEEAREDEGVWQPPSGQTGDGKTALNETLGY